MTVSESATDSLYAPQEISTEVLLEKYAKGNETSVEEVMERVAQALAEVEAPKNKKKYAEEFLWALQNGFIPGRARQQCSRNRLADNADQLLCPACRGLHHQYGRWQARHLYRSGQAAETMRRGGGVGYNFSSIRPRGAKVRGTGSSASGPISYMKVFDRSCETVESAGARRGAQMAVLNIDHPDIVEFITIKQEQNQLSNFNVSVGVTDQVHAGCRKRR